ncbi:hypothetical protein E4U32_004430 [Claviceps aff. humidiphila group G2b]|nr:hypothetical protein E4U32_004430 [Claviceps aff. humidiphila group G2b]
MRRPSPRAVGFVCESCASTRTQTRTRILARPSIHHGLTSCGFPLWRPRLANDTAHRWASSVSLGSIRDNQPSSSQRKRPDSALSPSSSLSSLPATQLGSPASLARAAEDSNNKFLSIDGIPTPQLTSAALETCLRAATALHPQLKRAEAQSKASASKLITLGRERTGARLPIDAGIQDAIDRVSSAAYTIITHPNVAMTPESLEVYVQIQAQLGRPETLPSVLELYATKPRPFVKNGQIAYRRQFPTLPTRAVEEAVADLALQTAIDAKNLDASLGIIEASYAKLAFKRQRLIRYWTAPAFGMAGLPFGVLAVAGAYATSLQNTMDVSTATFYCAVGIAGYIIPTGSLGLIALFSRNAHMKRVTWIPGTPLRYRWLREKERAALDRVACAWGFKESWRYGEETGPEWEGLKEYMGYRQMLLDRVEFMEGMS